jgi:hypothetical protein
MANNNLVGANTISTANITAGNGLFQNLVAYNTLFVSSHISSISSSQVYIDEAYISSLSSANGVIPSLNISSLNGQPISFYEPGSVSTISSFSDCSISSLLVSSINGSEFNSTGIVVQQLGVSSIVATSISTLGAEIRQSLVSTIQFKPEFPLNFNFDFASLGAGIKSGLTNIGIGIGGGLVAIASGIVASSTARNQTTTIVQNTFEQYAMPTQIQFSTINDTISSYTRFVSSSGQPNTVPGDEYLVSTIITPGTLCIRSIGDPVNLADPSTFTSSIQSYGQWVPVPVEELTNDLLVSSLAIPGSYSTTSGIISIGFTDSGFGGKVNFNTLQNGTTFQTLSEEHPPGGGGSLMLSVIDNNLEYSDVALRGVYFGVSSVASGDKGHIVAGSAGLELTNVSSINNVSYPPNPSQVSTSLITASNISTAFIQGANPNLFGIGLQGLEIDCSNLFLSTPNVVHPGFFNGSTIAVNLEQARIASISSATVSSIEVNYANFNRITNVNIITGSLANINGISTFELTCGRQAIFQSTLFADTVSTNNLIASTINSKVPAFQNDANSFSSITTSTLFSPNIVADRAFFSTQVTGNVVGSDYLTNTISSFSSIQASGAMFDIINGNIISSGSASVSSLSLITNLGYNLSSIINLKSSVINGAGTSTVMNVNTDISVGQNLLWARQVRLGYNNANDNISEVLMYGGNGDFRVFKSGSADTTIRVGTNTSGTNTGYLTDTLLNPLFFSTINQSTSMMCIFPSSISGSIGVSTMSVIPPKNIVGGFTSLSTQNIIANTPLVLWQEITPSPATGGITTSTNTIVIPQTGNYEVNTSIQFSKVGGSGTADFWFRVNGVDLANSGSEVYLPTSGLGQALGNVSLINRFNAGDKLQVVCASPDTGVSATFFQSTVGTPYTRPAIPSVITSVKSLNY